MESWKNTKYTFRTEVKATEWAFDRKEAFEKVAKDEARILAPSKKSLIRSTDYLRHIIAPAGRQRGVTISYLCPHCDSFQMEDYVWWVSGERSIIIQMVNAWKLLAKQQVDGRRPHTEHRDEPL